jgi:hypothetical protein
MKGEIRTKRHPLRIFLEGCRVLLAKYNEFRNIKIISNIPMTPIENINS